MNLKHISKQTVFCFSFVYLSNTNSYYALRICDQYAKKINIRAKKGIENGNCRSSEALFLLIIE